MEYNPYTKQVTQDRFRVYAENNMQQTLDTVWEHQPKDPFAVYVTFISDRTSTTWRFGRQLIDDALWSTPSPLADEGDVHLTIPRDLDPAIADHYLRLELINDENEECHQEVKLLVPRNNLLSFMRSVISRVSDQEASEFTQAEIDRDLQLY